MYTTMVLFRIAQNELKRGKRHQGLLIYQWNHIQIYSYNASIITLNRWQEGRGERAANDRHNIEKMHSFEFEHPLLWNQCYVTLLEKDRWKRVSECVRARTGMNSVSAEPNVRPIKVYWDQVVLVSLKVEADLFNQTWG